MHTIEDFFSSLRFRVEMLKARKPQSKTAFDYVRKREAGAVQKLDISHLTSDNVLNQFNVLMDLCQDVNIGTTITSHDSYKVYNIKISKIYYYFKSLEFKYKKNYTLNLLSKVYFKNIVQETFDAIQSKTIITKKNNITKSEPLIVRRTGVFVKQRLITLLEYILAACVIYKIFDCNPRFLEAFFRAMQLVQNEMVLEQFLPTDFVDLCYAYEGTDDEHGLARIRSQLENDNMIEGIKRIEEDISSGS
jgi:hypothetical protein